MRRMLILYRIAPFTPGGCPPGVIRGIRQDFSCLSPCKGQIAYVLLTRAPVAGGQDRSPAPAAPRLACVKPVASVHPEPGSNSSLLLSCLFSLFLKSMCKTVRNLRTGLYPSFLWLQGIDLRSFRFFKKPLALVLALVSLL